MQGWLWWALTGKVLARTANLSPGAATLPGSGVGVAFGYTGRPIDDKTGLSDYRARWYDASTGRFINEDPSGFAGGDTNLFRYVGNDPLDRIDPSGLTAKWAGGAKGSVPAAGWGAYGTGGLMSVSEFGRLSGSLGSQPSSGNAAPKSSSQFMASATQLFMQHFTGKPGVHDLYSDHGFPVSSRAVDSSGATREYKFADGKRYMEPTEPSTAQYADGASLAFAPLRVASQGGSALRVAGSAAGNVVDYAASNYASRRASEATGGYLAMMPAPVTAMLTRGRGGITSGFVGALDDGAGLGKTAGSTAVRNAVESGRAGRQARLRELANDPNLGSADRGWIKQEINSIERGQRATIRNPPGKDLAHQRGREAAKGYDYNHSMLQDRDLHRLQHKYDDFGRANAERPLP